LTGDRAIAGIAASQHGVVTRAQLLGVGLSRKAIQHRLDKHRLHPIHRGVYLVGHPIPPPLAREMAAVLACGDAAVISHDSAAAMWRIRSQPEGPIHITLSSRTNRSRPGIRLHFTRALGADEVRTHRGIPVTAPIRTLIDLASVLSLRELERAYEAAQVSNLLRPQALRSVLSASRARPGYATIKVLLDHDRAPALTRSEAERRLLDLLRAADLVPDGVNVRVGRHEVDFLWHEQRLVVEVDGFAYHANRAAFERDRLRDAELQAAGYRVMRVTWLQIEERPEAVIGRIAQALAPAAR
jgi:very-short-patch-repair endonuclease